MDKDLSRSRVRRTELEVAICDLKLDAAPGCNALQPSPTSLDERATYRTENRAERIIANPQGKVLALVIPGPRLVESILLIRGERVILGSELAALYGVSAKRLNEAVLRNRNRFPPDFMFRLTSREAGNLKSQIAISSWGGRRHRPYAFTEHGVAMLSSVLRSPRAVQVNIEIMRAFVRLRRWMADSRELTARLDALEARYDSSFKQVFDAIRQLMEAPAKEGGRVGFRSDKRTQEDKPTPSA